jgi:Uma2 family endonuclease
MTFGIPVTPPDELEYPSSDGQPMAETQLHGEAMVAAHQALKRYFAKRGDVQIGIDNLVYYEKGNSAARFAPDVYVAIGAEKRTRRVYKLWEEPVPPSFVLEVSSRGTWLADHGIKKALCERLGITDYFLFDPEAEYLDPVLQGFSLVSGSYQRVIPSADGSLESKALGLRLRAEGELVRFFDQNGPLPQTDEIVARVSEADARRTDAEARRADAEARRADAEARARAAEEELARFKASLDSAKK